MDGLSYELQALILDWWAVIWAGVTAAVAMGGLATSVWGVLVVRSQLRQNREAIAGAAKSSEAAAQAAKAAVLQSRPWLKLEGRGHLEITTPGNDGLAQVQLRCQLTNVGRTPGVKARVLLFPAPEPFSPQILASIEEQTRNYWDQGYVVFPGSPLDVVGYFQASSADVRRMVQGVWIACAVYQTAGDDEWFQTPRALLVSGDKLPDGAGQFVRPVEPMIMPGVHVT